MTPSKDEKLDSRRLRRDATFVLAVVGSLALTLGAATTMFAVVHAFLLSSLPYRSADRLVRALLAFAAVYYALWAASDVLILAGVDEGWLLRCVPNQLYYGLTVPFVWWRFFSPSYAASSTSTQASR